MDEYLDDFEEMLGELGPKTINERSLLEEPGLNTIERSSGWEHTDDHGDDTDTDARQPLPPLTTREQLVRPPLPSGPAPGTTPEEAAAATFASRGDLMRCMAQPGSFDAMLEAGRQPFEVWRKLPDKYQMPDGMNDLLLIHVG